MPDGLDPAAAAMAEPLAAAVHAIARAPAHELAPDVGVLGGGPMGQMLAALLVADGRTVTLADRHAERRAQAAAAGAMSAERLADHDVVFEAVGRPDAWREAVQACARGGCVVFVGGCKGGTDAVLPTRPLHYDELDLRGAFHHSPRGGRPRARAAGRGRAGLAVAGRRPDRPRRPRHGACGGQPGAGAQMGRAALNRRTLRTGRRCNEAHSGEGAQGCRR